MGQRLLFTVGHSTRPAEAFLGGWPPEPPPAIPAGKRPYPEMIAGPSGKKPAWWSMAWGRGWFEAHPMGARGGDGGFRYFHGHFSPAIRQAGWPCYALGSRVVPVEKYRGIIYPTKWQLPPGEIWRRGVPTNSLPEVLHARGATRLPLVPLWPGLAVDGVLYGLAAALAWTAGRACWCRVRRTWSRAPDDPTCAECGYNLTGLPEGHRCPECGTLRRCAPLAG